MIEPRNTAATKWLNIERGKGYANLIESVADVLCSDCCICGFAVCSLLL